jgi:hypothetical protein
MRAGPPTNGVDEADVANEVERAAFSRSNQPRGVNLRIRVGRAPERGECALSG